MPVGRRPAERRKKDLFWMNKDFIICGSRSCSSRQNESHCALSVQVVPSLRFVLRLAGVCVLAGLLAACGSNLAPGDNVRAPERDPQNPSGAPDYGPQGERDSIFGPGGLQLFGNDRTREETGGGGIGVNSFLWRASLDTIAFMPLSSADPFGGVIITDWYTPPETPSERFKINAYILSRSLRADGIKVTVFKQRRQETEWQDTPVEETVAVDLENAILTRARELRMAALAN